jgi:hypothetical protein
MLRRYELIEGKVKESQKFDSSILVYVNPDENEKNLINEQKLDRLTLNSALNPNRLARLGLEPKHTTLIFKRPKNYFSANNYLF